MNVQGILDKSMFRRYEKVISGHFHKKSDDLIKYIILVLNMKLLNQIISVQKVFIY